jgi:hypothetical protein
MEPELAEQAIYSEYEDNLQISDAETLAQWCQWVQLSPGRQNCLHRLQMRGRY